LTTWLGASERAPLAILWIGVDQLRRLNQTHGMGVGDEALRLLGAALNGISQPEQRPPAYAARMAGDEFVLVQTGVAADDVGTRAGQVLDTLNRLELRQGDTRIAFAVSIGACAADENCTAIEGLLKDAERACRAAKESGRARVYVHENADARLSQMRDTVQWLDRVEHSLEAHSLVLYGQRALSLSDRARQDPDYLEVLLRMRVEGGVASPEQFILAAERYGQITAIDRFVMRELTRLLHLTDGSDAFRIAFNVSARNIVDNGFVQELIQTLSTQPQPLTRLLVELTETAAIAELADASAAMQRLTAAGLSMVLDDFGSGWSSYQYLKRLPFAVVKVDGAFIRDIAHSAEDLALARSINEIAHLLGKRTVAEHVENQETLDCVRQIGFDYA
jgi:diguanylate cyclase (GGDEF)-like protein